MQHELSYFLAYSPMELRHLSYLVTIFRIPMSQMSAAWDWNHSVSEHRAQHFPRRHSLPEFRLAGRSTVMPMHWLLLGFWSNVCNPHFVTCDYPLQTRRRHHGAAAGISMLNPCALLCVLVSVAMLYALKKIITNLTSQSAGVGISLQLQPLQRCYCENSGSPASVCLVRRHYSTTYR